MQVMGVLRGIKYLFLISFALLVLYTLYYNISGEPFFLRATTRLRKSTHQRLKGMTEKLLKSF